MVFNEKIARAVVHDVPDATAEHIQPFQYRDENGELKLIYLFSTIGSADEVRDLLRIGTGDPSTGEMVGIALGGAEIFVARGAIYAVLRNPVASARAARAALDDAAKGLKDAVKRGWEKFAKPQALEPKPPVAPRNGLISENPANRLVETGKAAKSGGWRRRWLRMTEEDLNRYYSDVSKYYDHVSELARKMRLSPEQSKHFLFDQMQKFRQNWLDDCFKDRPYGLVFFSVLSPSPRPHASVLGIRSSNMMAKWLSASFQL